MTMDNTTNTDTCEFIGARNPECCGNLEGRRVNGKHTIICDEHFYEMVDQAMSLW